MHEALELPEPELWSVKCDVCGEISKEDVLAARANVEAMDEAAATKVRDEHSRAHFGQNLDEEPVLPYDDAATDVLHLYLNIVKVAVAHVFHLPFQVEKLDYSPDVKKLMIDLRDKLNKRMKEDFDDKKFGGEGTFALIGDQVKTFMRGGHDYRLVPNLLEIIMPYLDLLTSDGVVPATAAPAAAPAAAPRKGKGRPPKARGRGAAAGGRGAGRGGGAGMTAGGRGRGGHTSRTIATVQQPTSDGEEETGAAPEAGSSSAAAPAPEATGITYRNKVVTMFLSLSTHWMFTHSVNDRDATTILPAERQNLARQAYDLGCDVVQAVCRVCGDQARQTYLHDIVYALQKLFLILGKPYLAATEGNEAAHQEMKKDFHMMCSHSNQRAGSMLQLMRLHHLRKATFAKSARFAPRTKESEASLGMDLALRPYKRTKKDSDASIPVADSHLKAVIQAPGIAETSEKA